MKKETQNPQNQDIPDDELSYPPEPIRPAHLDEDDFTSPEAKAYWERYDQWCAQTVAIKSLQQQERLARIEEERTAADKIVFNLSRTYEDPPSCVFGDYSGMLDRNARILNAGFEYYLDKAVESSRADQKIGLGIRMQSQLVRTIDAWRRLENFHHWKTK